VRRIVGLVLCAVALAGVSACSSSSSKPAATVNGVDLPTQALIDELTAIGANTDYLDAYKGTVFGTKPGSFDAAFVAQILVQEIDYSLIHEEFGKRKLQPNDACKQKARDEMFVDLGNQDANKGEALFNKFGKRYQDVLLQRRVELLALTYATAGQTCGDKVDGAAYFKSHPDDFTNVCILAIAVPDQATADSVVAQARAGADFAGLARDLSIDPQSKANGGDIGCTLPGSFNTAVAAQLKKAAVGDVLEPFALQQQGFGIFKIYNRQPLSADQAQQAAEQLATNSVDRSVDLGAWLSQARTSAHITIDPRYGTFDQAKFTIDPPAGSASSSTNESSSTSDTP